MHHADAAYTAGFVIGTLIGLGIGVALVVVGAVRLNRGTSGATKAGWIVAVVFGALFVLGGLGSFATHR